MVSNIVKQIIIFQWVQQYYQALKFKFKEDSPIFEFATNIKTLLKVKQNMFSTIVQKLMISFLGEYIDGIRNSMDVALLKGRIRIQNVSLRRQFFDNLSLPLRLGFSQVESIDVHIPWTNLKQKPTTIEVNGIYALFYVNYELSEYKFDVEARFQEMIDKATEMIKMKFEQKQRDSDSIVEKYILRIVDNVKVKVKNIHIRLESVERGWDFSLGLLINRIGVHTVDENGQKHFFVRSKHHHYHHLHRKSKIGQDILYKKVKVQNIDIYFTQNEKDFLTLIQNKEAVLTRMKSFLIDLQLYESTSTLTGPKTIMSLKMEAMIRARLNEQSKYDIDVKASTCPLIFNLNDRMTAELFYFLQFAFEWGMQKYKKPNKDACMSQEMINFYKLVLANVLQDIPLHKNDYKTVLKLISEWTYEFLNEITLEFIQDQKIKRELARRKNQKIVEDSIRFEQFKKEIEDRILTQDERKEIFNIIGRVTFDMKIPNIEILLTKTEEAREIFGLKNPVILMIGLENISLTFNTLFEKDTTFTLAIEDFVLQQGQRQVRTLTEKQSLESFMTVIYTRSEHQRAESCSIKVSKRVISINQILITHVLEWLGKIRLRPATIHYLKEILVHYFTQIVKKYLLRLFKEFRVINLNLGLPVFALTLGEERKTMILDFGRLQGSNLSEQMYRFQLVQEVRLLIDENLVLSIEEGTMMEIIDKLKLLTEQRILELTDREKIGIKIKSIKIDNLHKLIDYSVNLINSPIVEKFLRLKIVEDHSILLEGTFYLNNNPRKQRIILKSDSMHFLPSKYSIELKRCKIYQMPLESKNYLVLHSLVTNKTDLIEVESEQAMDTIFYKIREMIHQNATGAEWDLFYKVDYPIMIDQLEVLKSQAGENLPLFSFEFEIQRIILPLEKYLRKSSFEESKHSPVKLHSSNVLNFLETNDPSFLQTNISKIQMDKIYMRIGFYQLTTDFFSEVRDIKLIIEDENVFKDLSFAFSCLKSEFLLMNFNLNSFEMAIKSQDFVKRMFEIGMFFENHIQKVIRTAQQNDFWNRIEVITRESSELSILSSSQSFTHPEKSHEAWFEQREKINVSSQSLLSVRLMFGAKSFKLNFLNYITEIKHLSGEVEMYRGDLFPFVKLKLSQAFIFSSLQLSNLRIEMERQAKQTYKYVCKLDIDKLLVFQHVEFIILTLAQGDLGNFFLEIIKIFEDRKNLKKTREKVQLYKQSQRQPRTKFQPFISPIKTKKQPLSQKKHIIRSIKSLTEELFQQNETYIFVINSNIRNLEAHVTLKDSMNIIDLTVTEISLNQNELRINQVKVHYGDLEMLKFNGIDIKLPRINLPTGLQSEHNVSIEMRFNEFQSPIKKPQKQQIQADDKVESGKKELLFHQVGAQILIDGTKINIDMKSLSDIVSFGKYLSNTLDKSEQFNLLREKFSKLLLNIVQKREKIQNIIEKGTQKLEIIAQNLKTTHKLPYSLSWIVDFQSIFSSIRIETLTPLIVQVFSTERKQMLHIEIGTKIDHPFFVNSFINLKINHFNKLIQIYEPVLEKTSIKIEKIDRKSEFRALIVDLKAIVTEELIVDICKDAKLLKDKLNQTSQISKPLLIQDLQFKKLELYERWFGSKGLIESTLKDFEIKRSHILESEFDILSEQKHKLDDLSKRGVFSKLNVRNYTQCEVLCELNQESFPRQQIHVLSEYELGNEKFSEGPKSYFMIPYHKTTKTYTKPSDFLEREFPLNLKICFVNQQYAFKSISFQTLLSEMSHHGQKREYFELFYEDVDGDQHSTMIEIFMSFNYYQAGITMEIRPKIEVINYTVLELGLSHIGRQTFGNVSLYEDLYSVRKGKSTYLPLWVQKQIAIRVNNYVSNQSTPRYTIPLQSQYSLAQNYLTENCLLMKEEFIHYFEVKLGSQFCWIPLLFVRVKKFEKITNKNTKQWNFKEVKCKIMVMPLVKIQNHCGRQIYINGEQFSSMKMNVERDVQIQQEAVYFFLHHQFKQTLNSILFAFYEKGLSYHINLPENLYVSKMLKFPSEASTIAPISLNLLTVKNEFGQMVFHFYPIVEVLMELPADNIECQMSCKYGQEEKQKICQGLNLQRTTPNTEDIPISHGFFTSYLITEDCQKLKFSIESDTDITESPNKGLFTSDLPSKKSLGYIDVFGVEFSTSQSQSSSSSSESISVSEQEENETKVESRIIYVPTTTKEGEMLFAKYEMKRIRKRFYLEEELASIYTPKDVEDIRQGSIKNKKYESFYVFELRCVQERTVEAKLIEQIVVKEVTEIPKVKEIQQKLKSKLASKSLSLLIKNLNFSFIIRKALDHETFIRPDHSFRSKYILGQREQLMNLSLEDYEINLSFAIDEKFKWNEIQLEQTIGNIMLNSIGHQKTFKDSILKLNENKFISIITGFTISKPQILALSEAQIESKIKREQIQTIELIPSLRLSKLLLKICDKKLQTQEGHHFDIKLTDLFVLQCMNWLTKMYPFISPLISTNLNQPLANTAFSSQKLSDMLKKFQGLIFCEVMKLRLSFLSLDTKSAHHLEKNKRIKKQAQNQQIQDFLCEILALNQSPLPKDETLAYSEGKTMRKILKYIKKIPFNVLEIQKATIIIPEIGINGKIADDTANIFEKDLLINGATGVLKGMKVLGNTGSLMDYLNKKNVKKSDKITGLFNRLAKGSVKSFTGVLKAFSNGISELTFDETYMQERQKTITQQAFEQKTSSSSQGFESLFLGFKSGFTGLVEQPVQNYQQEGAGGFIKGSIKGLAGMFTKPLTGILDLGTKTLEGIRGENKNIILQQSHFSTVVNHIYCRPLFHQSLLVRKYNTTQYLVYVILKTVLRRQENFGLISAFLIKQDPFNSDEKENQNIELQRDVSEENLRYVLAIGSEKTFVIQLGKKDASRVISKVLPHSLVKMVGRSENGVCLVLRENFEEDQKQSSESKRFQESTEIFINPVNLIDKQEIYRLYKRLAKK